MMWCYQAVRLHIHVQKHHLRRPGNAAALEPGCLVRPPWQPKALQLLGKICFRQWPVAVCQLLQPCDLCCCCWAVASAPAKHIDVPSCKGWHRDHGYQGVHRIDTHPVDGNVALSCKLPLLPSHSSCQVRIEVRSEHLQEGASAIVSYRVRKQQGMPSSSWCQGITLCNRCRARKRRQQTCPGSAAGWVQSAESAA